jgi:hypothetical protein
MTLLLGMSLQLQGLLVQHLQQQQQQQQDLQGLLLTAAAALAGALLWRR